MERDQKAGPPSNTLPATALMDQPQSRFADILRYSANSLSVFRAIGGVALGYKLAVSEYPAESFVDVMAVGGLAATDYFDGLLARTATAVDGRRSKVGGWFDQLADKIFVGGALAGLAWGSFANNRPETGAVIAAAGAVFVVRDAVVTRRRRLAEQANLAINTDAKWHGKVKTTLQFGALTALASPAMESQPVSWTALGLLGASAVMAVFSARQYQKSFDAAMGILPQNNSQPVA